MGRAPDRAGEDVPGHRQRQVILPEVQHIGTRRICDVGAVVDRDQCVVATGGVGEHLQRGQLVAGLQRTELPFSRRSLVAQLDDVDPAGQGGVGELREIAALPAGVGAQVQVGVTHTANRSVPAT